MALRPIPFPQSSNIVGITYDDESGDLFVTFARGAGVYKNVDVQTAEGFERAGSAMGYLNLYIKNSHLWERLS